VNYRLIHADVLDGLRQLADASIDAVVTDPPYGEKVAAWDVGIDFDFHVAWLTEAHRALKPHGTIIAFSSRRRVDLLMGGGPSRAR
jgi:site-specific DNA-methyltransferase (adenine-specific)